MGKLGASLVRRGWRGDIRSISWVVLGLLLILGVVWVALGGAEINQDAQPFFSKPIVAAIHGDVTVSQLFVAQFPGLSQVSVLVGTNGRRNAGPILFVIRDVQSGTDVARASIDSSTIVDNSYVTFSFPAQPLSERRAYRVTFAAPNTPDHLGITLWWLPYQSLSEGRAYLSGVPLNGELTFRLGYRLTNREAVRAVADAIADGRPGVWGWPTLYGLLGAGLVVATVVVIRSTLRSV